MPDREHSSKGYDPLNDDSALDRANEIEMERLKNSKPLPEDVAEEVAAKIQQGEKDDVHPEVLERFDATIQKMDDVVGDAQFRVVDDENNIVIDERNSRKWEIDATQDQKVFASQIRVSGYKGQYFDDERVIEKIVKGEIEVADLVNDNLTPRIDKTDATENREERDLKWDENLDRDLNMAAREPRRWVDPTDRSKGLLPDDNIAEYQQKINEATERLGTRGYDVRILKTRDGRKRVANARRIVFGGMDPATIGMTTEDAEKILDGMDIDVKKAKEESEKKNKTGKETVDLHEDREDERSYAEFIKNLKLLAMDSKVAEDRGMTEDRKRAIRTLEKSGIDINFVFGEDLDEDDIEGRRQRKKEVRRAINAMISGTINEDQSSILRSIGIDDVTKYGATIETEETPEDEVLSPEKGFRLEYGCSQEEYDRLVKACLDDIFANGMRSEQQVLNNLTNPVTGEWIQINRGRKVPLPPKVLEKLKELKLEAWIGVANVMSAWADLKEVSEITAGTLKAGLFTPRYVEMDFDNMKNMRFPVIRTSKDGKVDQLFSYKETEVVPDIGQNVSRAMEKLINYFGQTQEKNPLKLKNDYWKFISSEASVRAGLYESLGLNRYEGEAAFAFLLSNFMIAKKGVGLDSFSILVKPAEKMVANYEVDEVRDPRVRLIVQKRMNLEEDAYIRESDDDIKNRRRMEVLSYLKEMVPSTFIPTGLDNGGEAALSSAGGWVAWRNTQYLSLPEREKMIGDFEKSLISDGVPEDARKEKLKAFSKGIPVASDIESRLTILRSAIDINIDMKAAVAQDADVSKIASVKTKLFIHLVANLTAAGYGLDLVDFEGKKSRGSTDWISRTMLGVIKPYLYIHSIADSENRNGKPWSMVQFVAKSAELFQTQAQSGKNKYVGFDQETSTGDRRDLVKFIESLYEDNQKIIKPLSGIFNIAKAAVSPNHGIPNWYGKYEDLSESFKAFLQSQTGYEGQWVGLKKVMYSV